MLAKVIARGATRADAIAQLLHHLQDMQPAGIRTNRNYLLDLLDSSEFREGRCTIDWLSHRSAFTENHCATQHAAAAAIFLDHGAGQNWRSSGITRSLVTLKERGNRVSGVVENFVCNGFAMTSVRASGNMVWAEMQGPDGSLRNLMARMEDRQVHIVLDGRDALFEDITYVPAERKDAAGAGAVRAPMAGKIVKLMAEPGQAVARGDLLVILEAMKMEHELRAATDGIIDTITIKAGDQVAMRQLLVTVKPL
jgi:geranyl-CoA carboxylase alpha subunit